MTHYGPWLPIPGEPGYQGYPGSRPWTSDDLRRHWRRAGSIAHLEDTKGLRGSSPGRPLAEKCWPVRAEHVQ